MFGQRVFHGIEWDGKYRDYFPSQREEIIEDALRKLGIEGDGVYLDLYVSVVFTFYKLMMELRRVKHGYNLAEIIICASQ